jgi:predicted SnoaL-like aldol condensation-catalyzing enzyme/predicted ester cyclase
MLATGWITPRIVSMNQTENDMRPNVAEQNKATVLRAFDTLFNQRDYAAAERYWSPNYVQHSAHIEPGRAGLFNLVKSSPPTLRYENGLIMAEGDFVILHGRFSGNGLPKNWVVADVVRVVDGLLVEHWDVIQDEASSAESKSGLPMFGTSFPEPDGQPDPTATASSLTVDEARKIVAPLYDALNQPARKDVAALLADAANPDYRSYHTNEDWLSRDQLAEVFKTLGAAVPDLRWTIEDIRTFGDRIVVRGKAAGTPDGEFWGSKPTGKSFDTMAIDIFTVRNGKLASAYHAENWVGALQQIGK